ncbi:hypothetical protein J5491_02385 [Candidatus Saccharibacteria bacterium]|nr:hypothetical protein [Candidatus Saccharibacteria bacterium]
MLMKSKVIMGSAVVFVLGLIAFSQGPVVSAAEQEVEFQVNVKDFLSVSITTPSEWAVGDVNTFLRNKVSITVNTNDDNGFVASMATKSTSTDLVHVADKGTIHTLTSNYPRGSFPADRWGYSLNDTDAGDNSSTYSAMAGASGAPITLISSAQSQTINSRDIFFGAKASTATPSGKYASTVVISVVTGNIDNDNPITPVDPARPNPMDNVPIYSGGGTTTGGTTNGATTYTYRRTNSTNHTNSITTEVSDGDNRSAYSGYTPPQGVSTRQENVENVASGTSLATGLAIASGVAALAGVGFFVASKNSDKNKID